MLLLSSGDLGDHSSGSCSFERHYHRCDSRIRALQVNSFRSLWHCHHCYRFIQARQNHWGTEAYASPKFCPVRHALDPAGGAYNFPPDSLAGFWGTYVYRRGKVRREGYREIREKSKERETNGGDRKGEEWREERRGEECASPLLKTFRRP